MKGSRFTQFAIINLIIFIRGGEAYVSNDTPDLSAMCKIIWAQGTAWPLHSIVDETQSILNAAMPDYNGEYWTDCFNISTASRPILRGKFPEWTTYASLSTYDMSGNSMTGCHTSSFTHTIGRTYDFDVFSCIPPETVGSFFVVSRTYSATNWLGRIRRICTNELTDERFAVVYRTFDTTNKRTNDAVNDRLGDEQTIPNTDKKSANRLSSSLERPIQTILSHIIVQPNVSDYLRQFHTVSHANLIGLFPNIDSDYMIRYIDPSKILIVNGYSRCPSANLVYYGFMVSNTLTSATDASINWQSIESIAGAVETVESVETVETVESVESVGPIQPQQCDSRSRFRLIVFSESADISNVAFRPTDCIMTWPESNQSPVLVLRFIFNPMDWKSIVERAVIRYSAYLPVTILELVGIPMTHYNDVNHTLKHL